MHPGTSTGRPAPWVRKHLPHRRTGRIWYLWPRDDAKQVGGRYPLAATDAGPDGHMRDVAVGWTAVLHSTLRGQRNFTSLFV
jgi:hypothetical protein